jgi:hypothetical protein
MVLLAETESAHRPSARLSAGSGVLPAGVLAAS